MPIYEYKALRSDRGCAECRDRFEMIQGIHEKPLSVCPYCGTRIQKVVSVCHVAVLSPPVEYAKIEGKIKEYEKSGMWSHAAELADKCSERTRDRALKTRALDNYKKAGYDADSFAGHMNND